jgi:hypothetical protein
MAGEPREFGPYRLIRRLGVGGMAETFEAMRTGAGGFEQRLCLKRVLPAFCEDEELVARFQREARLAARLRHTNIVGVIDAGEIDGTYYIALELVDGVDLRSFLKSSPGETLSPDTVTLIAMDLAYGLEHAHGTLVHRDVSPSNILLSRSGETKLADFGVAKALDNARATVSRTAKGKIPYMAPEHIRGEAVDGRADLFSLGVVMFEALSGSRPFDGAHDVETMQRILEGKRASLADIAPNVPPQVCQTVERLLMLDRDARTPSASALLEELAEVGAPPGERRALAASVDALRGGPGERLHVRAKDAERDTELTRPPAPAGPPKPVPAAKRRPTRWVVAALLGAFVLAATATRDDGREETAGLGISEVERVVPASAKKAPADSVANPTRAAAPSTESTSAPAIDREEARRPDRALVRVVVEPWGDVTIDGRAYGRAPVKARLAEGRHIIVAQSDGRRARRVVRVRPGDRREVVLVIRDE